MTPEECIEAIRNLPDSRLEAHGIRIGYSYKKDDDSLVLAAAREEYLAKSQWLEFWWLNRIEFSNELTSTWKILYRPHGERTSSFKRLAQEIYQRSYWMQEQRVTPLDLTLACETQLCEEKLTNSGYFSDLPATTGKRENYNNAMKHYDELEATHKIIFEKGDFWLYPLQALEESAIYIAKTDRTFNNTYYRDYLLQQKRYHRQTGKGELNVIRLDRNGVAELVGRGNSLSRGIGQSK